MGHVAVKLPALRPHGPIAQPRSNQLVIGLGFQKWNSKILLTLIVAKHLPIKCKLVLFVL